MFHVTHQIIHHDDVFPVKEIGEWKYETQDGKLFHLENDTWYFDGKPISGVRVSIAREQTKIPRYQKFSRILGCIDRCHEKENKTWQGKWEAALKKEMDTSPSGSGWDCGTKLDDDSTPEKLEFYGGFHHMDENGFYDGWTEHRIIVKASMEFDIDIKVTGRDRNDIKDYLHSMFHDWLTEFVAEFD